MKIVLLLIGKSDASWLREAIDIYEERLSHYVDYRRVEVPEIRNVAGLSVKQMKEKESELLLKNIKPSDKLVLLDEKGEVYSSEEFANYIDKQLLSGTRNLVFAIGGPYGFSESVYNRADSLLSLSKLTFTHQMVRVIFLEQLYRAFTIIRGEQYHHKQ
ncbi:MAG: 23S rRNA (pseudouridine(1915)-N(3))-methyltransferase RlmH [Rikenellaceae bacterium]|jgi:23S rRNA (pseudouridine1915-N3)-methyltransferase|nr:23S rRNA (pseudouridine(1915)-N(3))-methyltransferase RlmH [Bacteroidales bacterium]